MYPQQVFPIDSFVSLIAQIDGHASLEVGLVGDKGIMRTSLMLGVNVVPLHAVVQGTGLAGEWRPPSFCGEITRRLRFDCA